MRRFPIRDIALVCATAILCAVGIIVVVGLRIGSFDRLPAENRDVVARLATAPAGPLYAWKDVLPAAEAVCIVSFDADPPAVIGAALHHPVSIDRAQLTSLREQHWSIALVRGGTATLLHVPLSQLRLAPNTSRCDDWALARFRIREDGDKRYIEPQPPAAAAVSASAPAHGSSSVSQ